MDNANRAMRIGFIVAQTEAQRKRIYPPRYAIFTKGDETENLIIVGLDGHSFSTLYRARGVLAQLTASARASTFLETSQLKIYLLSLILLGCLVVNRLQSVAVKPIHIGSTLNSSSGLMHVCSAYLSRKLDFIL